MRVLAKKIPIGDMTIERRELRLSRAGEIINVELSPRSIYWYEDDNGALWHRSWLQFGVILEPEPQEPNEPKAVEAEENPNNRIVEILEKLLSFDLIPIRAVDWPEFECIREVAKHAIASAKGE